MAGFADGIADSIIAKAAPLAITTPGCQTIARRVAHKTVTHTLPDVTATITGLILINDLRIIAARNARHPVSRIIADRLRHGWISVISHDAHLFHAGKCW